MNAIKNITVQQHQIPTYTRARNIKIRNKFHAYGPDKLKNASHTC